MDKTNHKIQDPPAASPVISDQEFAALFSRFREPFVNIAFSYIHDRSAAEDIVSGTKGTSFSFLRCRKHTSLHQ